MGGDHEFGLLGVPVDQAHPQQRRLGQLEPRRTVLGQQPLQLVRAAGQGHLPPRQNDPRGDDLHELAGGVRDERGTQRRMPIEQGLARSPHPVGIHVAAQVQHELHLVGVLAGRVQQRVKQDPLLQRGERPDIGQPSVALVPPIELGLAHPNQRDVRGGEATAAGRADVRGEGDERRGPLVGEPLYLVVRQQADRKGESGRQLAGLGDRADDLQAGQDGHARVQGR